MPAVCLPGSPRAWPFAVDVGLVKAVEPVSTVPVFDTNSRKVLSIHAPVKDGQSVVSGDYPIDGVPGTTAKRGVNLTRTRGQDRLTPWPVAAARASGIVRRSCPVRHQPRGIEDGTYGTDPATQNRR